MLLSSLSEKQNLVYTLVLMSLINFARKKQIWIFFLIYILTATRPLIWGFGILYKSYGPTVDTAAVTQQIAQIHGESSRLLGRAQLSSAQIASLPADRVDAGFRDKELLQNSYAKRDEAYFLEQLLRNEQTRLTYVEDRPWGYGFVGLGIIMLTGGYFLLRVIFRQTTQTSASTPGEG